MEEIQEITNRILKDHSVYIFPEYYPHTNEVMWKILNPYTLYAEEKVVLSSIGKPMIESLVAAEKYLKNAKDYWLEHPETHK